MAREMKIGDKVLCVDDSRTLTLKIGNEYTIESFGCCSNCGTKGVYLSEIRIEFGALRCSTCRMIANNHRQCFGLKRFILPDIESLHAHRVEVSAKELTEIKTHQLS